MSHSSYWMNWHDVYPPFGSREGESGWPNLILKLIYPVFDMYISLWTTQISILHTYYIDMYTCIYCIIRCLLNIYILCTIFYNLQKLDLCFYLCCWLFMPLKYSYIHLFLFTHSCQHNSPVYFLSYKLYCWGLLFLFLAGMSVLFLCKYTEQWKKKSPCEWKSLIVYTHSANKV